ncbi:jg26395, partial [Pararge aegeria aegeria]
AVRDFVHVYRFYPVGTVCFSGSHFCIFEIQFPQMTFPTLPQFPPLPAIPALPNFPNFPNFPNIQIPEIKFPEIKMPEIKMPEIKMPDIKIPEIKVPETLDELNSQKGSGFHSSYMVYSSDGSASIIINDEGRIRQIT